MSCYVPRGTKGQLSLLSLGRIHAKQQETTALHSVSAVLIRAEVESVQRLVVERSAEVHADRIVVTSGQFRVQGDDEELEVCVLVFSEELRACCRHLYVGDVQLGVRQTGRVVQWTVQAHL